MEPILAALWFSLIQYDVLGALRNIIKPCSLLPSYGSCQLKIGKVTIMQRNQIVLVCSAIAVP